LDAWGNRQFLETAGAREYVFSAILCVITFSQGYIRFRHCRGKKMKMMQENDV